MTGSPSLTQAAGKVCFLYKGPPKATAHAYNLTSSKYTFPLSLSSFKLHYLNKGQLRTLFAKLAHCSFKTLGIPEFGGIF